MILRAILLLHASAEASLRAYEEMLYQFEADNFLYNKAS